MSLETGISTHLYNSGIQF